MSGLKYPKCHDCALVDCGERANHYPVCFIKISDAPRPAVKEFAILMEKQLRANDHKGGWCKCSYGSLMDELYPNYRKLSEAIDSGDLEGIIKRAANVANFAMMISDNARRFIVQNEEA